MNNRITKLLAIMAIMTVSCDREPMTQSDIDKNMRYIKDNKTGLCFAEIVSFTKDGFIVRSITNVPCEKVERYISTK